jgi:ubiquinone biosynthesis protein
MSLLTAVRDMDRLRQITQVLMRHGFGELVTRLGLSSGTTTPEGQRVPRPQLGERLRLVLQDLGPTFVKLGQIMSTRSDLLPEDILAELKKLQDNVAPFPADEARRQVEDALGASPEEVFATFDGKPIASASVGQVHRATLVVEGHSEPVQVAVKIQRPGIVPVVQRDLDLLYLLARLIERQVPESRVYSPTGLVQEFDRAITAELDFAIEASNARRFAENFAADAAIRFPKIFAQASGKRVLTQEFLDGLKVDLAVKAGASGEWISHTAVRVVLKMVFEDGFFHADPHPGNILILPRPVDGTYPPAEPLVIGLLDLGLVGRLSPELRDRIVDLLMAAASNDADGIAEAMLAIGRQRQRVDYEAFRAHIHQLSSRHLGKPLRDIQASAVVRDIVAGAMKFSIEIPVELTMVIRAIMTIEGVAKEVYPELDLLAVAKPYLTKIAMQRYHPVRMGMELLRGAGRLSTMAKDLPFQLQDILEDLRQGRLQVRTNDPEAQRSTERLSRRIRAAILSSALLASGVALLIAQVQPNLAWGLVAGSAAWILGHLAADWRSRRPRPEAQDRR